MRKIAILMTSLILCLFLTSCMTIKAVMYDPNAVKEEIVTPTENNIPEVEEGSYEDALNNSLNSPPSTANSSKPSMLIMIPLIIISLGLTILIIISQWKLFTKAGEKGWKSLVPIYNMWTLFKIAYGEGIRMFLTWIPVAGFIFMILFLFALADAYGREKIGFKLGLLFLAPIFVPIMGLSKKIQYIGPKAKK